MRGAPPQELRRTRRSAHDALAIVNNRAVYIVHGTAKFRQRVHASAPSTGERSTTALGVWYANVLFWRPQVALFVNDATLLPMLVPMAPAATVLSRFPSELATVLQLHGVNEDFIGREVAAMSDVRLDKSASRSTLGSMNEFVFLAEVRGPNERADLLTISLELAHTPCHRKDRGWVFPDAALKALVDASTGT